MAIGQNLNRRALLRGGLVAGAGGVAAVALAGCGEAQIVEVIKEVPVERVVTQIVEKAVIQEKIVTKIVEVAPPQKKAVTITLWAEPHTLVDPIFAEHVPLFHKLYPHITVKHVIIPWSDIPVKTLTSMAAGDNPDIAYNHPQLNANFAAKGVIDPIDPYIKTDSTFDFDDYLEGPIAEFRWKGKVWALPLYNGPLLYVYNRDLMEKIGMGDPWELFQAGNWTIDMYDKMGEAAIALGGEGQDRIFADRETPRILKIFYLWNWGTGGKIWNSDPTVGGDDPTETLMHEPAALKGWDWMLDRVKDERHASGSSMESFGGAEGMFISGKLAFYLASRWTTTRIPPDFSAGVVPMYKHPNGDDTSRNACNALSIHSSGKNKDEAWEVLKYWTSTVQKDMVAVGYSAPWLKSTMKSPVWEASIVPWDNVEVHNANLLQDRKPFYHPPGYEEINALTRKAYDEAALGKSTADAFADAKPKIDQVLVDNLPS